MFIKSFISVCRNLTTKSLHQQHLDLKNARTFFVTSKARHQEQQSPQSSPSLANENQLFIEDNLKLDIKDSDDTTVIDVIPVSTGREDKLVRVGQDKKACSLCRLNLRNLDYTDVMILSQFIKRNGSLVTYHESKLCSKQYIKVERLIKQAQRCNLIPRPADYFVPGAWHDLNTYIEPDRRRDQPMKYVKKEYWKI